MGGAIPRASLAFSGGGRLESLQPGRGERDPVDRLPVKFDLECIVPGPRERHVEDEDGAGLHVGNPRGRLPELDRALAAQELRARLIHEADPDAVDADLRAPPPHPQHEMGPRMDRRELGDPDMLEDPQDRKLSLLIDEGVVGKNREVESQAQLTRIDSITSFF